MKILRRDLLRVAKRCQLGGQEGQERLRDADAPGAEEVPQDRGGLLERVGVRRLGEGRPFDGAQEQRFGVVGRWLAVDDGGQGVFEWGQGLRCAEEELVRPSCAEEETHTSKAF